MGTMVWVPSIWWGWSAKVNFVPFTEQSADKSQADILPALISAWRLSAIHHAACRTIDAEGLGRDISAPPGQGPLPSN